MDQVIREEYEMDQDGNPEGGRTTGQGINIRWQRGPLGRGPERRAPNGAFVEGVIAAAIGRLRYYQESKFKCRENALALTKLEESLHWLTARTVAREARGVEGTYEV